MKKLSVAALFLIFVLLGVISASFIKPETESDGVDGVASLSSGSDVTENDALSPSDADSTENGTYDGDVTGGHNGGFNDGSGGNAVSAEGGSESDASLEESGHPLPKDAVAVSKFGWDTKFRVSEYDGKVAVFKEGETEPMWVLSSSVLSLPDVDRDLLKEGIEVTGGELDLILSDFVG